MSELFVGVALFVKFLLMIFIYIPFQILRVLLVFLALIGWGVRDAKELWKDTR